MADDGDERPGTEPVLRAALADERAAAAQIARQLRTEAQGDETARPLLDAVATAAADSPIALELLLAAIDDLGLARHAVRRLVLDAEGVDDVCQDVLISVAEKISSFRGDSRFTTWLYQVARFKAIDQLRRTRPAEPLDDVAPMTDAARISSMIADRTVLRTAIEELPDHYRDAVVLRDVERLSYEEVAARAEIPLNTAKTRIARGRALLAGRLIDGSDDGDGDGRGGDVADRERR